MLKIYHLLAAALFAAVIFTAEINPELIKWKKIERGVEIIDFPLNKYILQIKSYRTSVSHEGDPNYGNGTVVDKSTSMLVHYMVKGRRVGQFVWNTIPYVAGTDVIVFGCQNPYSRYKTGNPCNGQNEQIWSWDFSEDGAVLSCFDEVQYQVQFKGASNPACEKLGTLEIDQLRFTNMAGFYYRAKPTEELEDLIQKTDPQGTEPRSTLTPIPPTTTTPFGNPRMPTCDCWTRECGYCKNLNCAVKHDLTSSETGVTVTSVLNRKVWNAIKLYNSAGEKIGWFKWNLKAMFLEGCIFCRSPRMPGILKGDFNEWNFSMKDGVIKVSVGGVVRFQQKLRRGCKKHYADVKYFAFQRMSCANSFVVDESMAPGSLFDGTCSGQCDG